MNWLLRKKQKTEDGSWKTEKLNDPFRLLSSVSLLCFLTINHAFSQTPVTDPKDSVKVIDIYNADKRL